MSETREALLKQEGMRALRNGHILESYAIYRQLARLKPDNAHLWYVLGMLLARKAYPLSAQRRFQRALACQPQLLVAQRALQEVMPAAQAFQKQVKIPQLSACVSVVVLTHNQWGVTNRCLTQLLAKTPEMRELIIIDNASTDETPDQLQRLAARDPRVRVVLNAQNRGFAAGCNQGLALAQAPYQLLLNNDVMVTSGWLARLLNGMEAQQADLVGPAATGVDGLQNVVNMLPQCLEDRDLCEEYAQQRALRHADQVTEIHRLVGFCLLMRRRVLEQIGGLDTRFGIGYFEDDDFCYRALRAGLRLRWVPGSFVHHLGSVSFVGAGHSVNALCRSNWRVFEKMAPSGDLSR